MATSSQIKTACVRIGMLAQIFLLSMVAAPHLMASITSDVPAGFEELAREQRQLLDVYFEDRLLGSFMAVVKEDAVIFDAPEDIINRVDNLVDPQALISEIKSRKLLKNLAQVCPTKHATRQCGLLEPDVVGIIYSPNDFRVDLFINPEQFRLQSDHLDFLPPPAETPSLISQFSAYKSGGSTKEGQTTYIENQSTFGFGSWRAKSWINYSDRSGTQIEEALFEKESGRERYFGGYLQMFGNELFSRRSVYGLGLESQNDTLLRKEEAFGTPLNVYLRERGRVEIFLEDRLLLAKRLAAGSHSLDTSSFPNGSYQLDIRISEGGRAPRTEAVYFSKDRRMPLLGRPNYELLAGIAQSPETALNPKTSFNPFARATGAIRITEKASLSGAIEFYDDHLYSELGFITFGFGHRIDASLATGTDGSEAARLRVGSADRGLLNYSFDLRYSDRASEAIFAPDRFGFDPSPDRFTSDLLQITGNVSYSTGPVQLFALGSYRSSEERDEYELGARATWNLFRKERWLLFANADALNATSGNSFYAGLTLSFVGGNGGLQIESGVRGSGRDKESSNANGFFNAVRASADIDLADRAVLRAVSSFEQEPRRQNIDGAIEADLSAFNVNVSGSKTALADRETNQYSFGGRTALVINGSSVHFTGSPSVTSAVNLKLSGGRDYDEFEILIDNQPRMRMRGKQERLVELTAYEQYQIRLRPVSTGPLSIDMPARSITLLPGNAATVEWNVALLSAVFGRLTDEVGRGIANARISSLGSIAQSDDFGYFQIEAQTGAPLEITLTNGEAKVASLPRFDPQAEFVELGEIVVANAMESEQ